MDNIEKRLQVIENRLSNIEKDNIKIINTLDVILKKTSAAASALVNLKVKINKIK